MSELHQDVKNNLMNEDVEKVKNWQKEAYHKQMIGGFKEAKEAEEGFKKAQKPWAKKLKEVRTLDHPHCLWENRLAASTWEILWETAQLSLKPQNRHSKSCPKSCASKA